jgi:hypothetical protein
MRSNQPKATIRPTSSVNINHLNRTLPSGCGQVDALYAAWQQISILRSSSALRVSRPGSTPGEGPKLYAAKVKSVLGNELRMAA